MIQLPEKILTSKGFRQVVAIYEDKATRDLAVAFCDQLIQQSWGTYDLDIRWWSLSQLARSDHHSVSSQQASSAELILFAIQPGKLSGELSHWVETWLPLRGEREGTLVGLLDPCHLLPTPGSERHHYLRSAAHRAGLDYLTQVPPGMGEQIPNSLDSFNQRADEVSHLLHDILRRTPPPPRLDN